MGRTVGTKDRSGCLMGELGLVGNMGSLFLPSFGLNAEKPVCFVFRSGAAAAVTGSHFCPWNLASPKIPFICIIIVRDALFGCF